MSTEQGRAVYLDNAATTPICPEALQVMNDVLAHCDANPSSAHELGRRAKDVLEGARHVLASCLGVDDDEMFFTSGATESNNLAIRGVCTMRARDDGPGLIITSALEHPSVTKAVRGMKRAGWRAGYIDAPGGQLDLESLERMLDDETPVLASVMAVQNEAGFRFPIDQVAETVHRAAPQAIVHSDAVQAFGKVPVDPRAWGVDLLTVSSHKLGGPKGVGALYVRRGVRLFSNALGGGQERGLRSGTEPVYAIAGFAAAAQRAVDGQRAAFEHAASLKRLLVGRLSAAVPSARLNSRDDGSPFIVSFNVEGLDNDAAVQHLSDCGIYVSKASACTENHITVEPGTWRPKHPQPLLAAGLTPAQLASTLRVSFAASNTAQDVEAFVAALASYLDSREGRSRAGE